MKIAFFTSAERSRADDCIPPGTVVMIGPNLQPEDHRAVRVRSCPAGEFSAAAAGTAWNGLDPDFLLVEADGDLGCTPRQLSSLPLCRVLLVGNSHLSHGALSRLICYASSEPFDRIVLSSREDARLFAAAGLTNLSWLPGLFRSRVVTEGAESAPWLCFGHRASSAYRAQCLERELRERWVTEERGGVPPVAIVVGNGGECTEGLVEAFLSGRAVLAERPARSSGWDRWIVEGRDCVFFDSMDQLMQLVAGLQREPARAAHLAKAAQELSRQFLSPDARRQQLVDLLTFADRSGPWSISEPTWAVGVEHEALERRLAGYELLQDLHRTHETVAVWPVGEVPVTIADDLAAFPRVRLVAEAVVDSSPVVALVGAGDFSSCLTDQPGAAHAGFVWTPMADQARMGRLHGAHVDLLRRGLSVVERVPPDSGRRPRKGRRRALATIAVGEKFTRLFREFAWPSWQAYARRHGLDLVVFDRAPDSGPRARSRSASWQKCLILEQPELRGFEQVAWVDADIVMQRTSPSIFDCVPVELVGAVDNDGYPSRAASRRIRGLLNRQLTALLGRHEGLPGDARQDFTARGFAVPREREPLLIQAGVWVASPECHRAVFRDVYDRYDEVDRSYEMVPLGYELWRRGLVRSIDWRFNAVFLDAVAVVRPALVPALLRGVYCQGFAPEADQGAIFAAYTGLNQTYGNVFWMHFAGGYTELAGLLRQPAGSSQEVVPCECT